MEENIQKYLTENFKTKLANSPRVRFHRRFVELQSLLDKITASECPEKRSIKEELYCLNNVLEECQMLARKKSLTSLKTLVQIRRSLDKIEQSLASSHETFCLLPQRLEASRGSSAWVDPSRVHGLENEVVSLERMLLQPGKSSDSFNAIAIIGVSGVGKTTLAQLVFNKQEVKTQFLPRIWLSLSPQHNVSENPTEAIAKKHGLPGILYALHLQLLGKKYLIVLDDMWDTNPWHDNTAWDRLPKGCGGSVIITSRSEEVVNTMVGEDNVLRLQPLTDPESCWCIFKDEVEKDGETLDDDNIKKLKPDVTKKSAGLPLAAKVMGEIFYEKRKTKEGDDHGEIHPQES
ncbi:NB-ARC domain-containing protein [Psidium guajava]|nr:NB-ARC domain-containing protein [Psidium guajava]